jgi:hypothetical protein
VGIGGGQGGVGRVFRRRGIGRGRRRFGLVFLGLGGGGRNRWG